MQPLSLSCQTIIARALDIAKNPGYTTQAGEMLQAELDNLALNYDWQILRKKYTFNANPPTADANGNYRSANPMPADFVRTREVYYLIEGQPFMLNAMSLAMYDSLFSGPGIQNYPENYATDMNPNPPLLYLYPPPTVPIQVFMRYQSIPPPIANPATNTSQPWFPYAQYLIRKVAQEVFLITDDQRYGQMYPVTEQMLKDILKIQGDAENYVRTIGLDPLIFRPQSFGPNKMTGF